MSQSHPLEALSSIKLKLALLVGVSVLLSTLLAAVGVSNGVPWWLFVPISVMVALAVTQLLAVGMTAPLREMTAASQRMAKGDYNVRVRATGSDEVGALARAFNAMAADLASVDEQRRTLVATVAHEIRTPLTALSAHIENMADGVTKADKNGIETALTQVERLRDLVRHLLELSKVEAGVTALDLSPLPMSDFLAQCVADARLTTVDLLVEPAQLTITADEARLRQVVMNLLENASRHSPADAVIRVSAHERAGSVCRIEVSDQGQGIAAEDRERVFERFGTAHEGGGGTGLGLAIAQWITGLHGGHISAVDPLPGETGARIRVDLPMHASPPPVAAPAVRTPSTPVLEQPLAPVPIQVGAPQVSPPSSIWPDIAAPRRLVLAAAIVLGIVGGVVLPYRTPGIGFSLLTLASGALVWWVARDRHTWFTRACAGICVLLAVVPAVRAAEWLWVLSALAAGVTLTAGLTSARTVPGFVIALSAWPGSAIRGLPWLSRMVIPSAAPAQTARRMRLVRTTSLTALAVLVFASLLASGDALMAKWVDDLVPDVTLNMRLAFRGFTALAVFGAVLSSAYLAMSPPEVPGPVRAAPTSRRYEWLAPVLAIDAVFALFLAAQAATFFGGRIYFEQTTGLTYADYVHQGFGQLTLATMLTLVVIRVGLHKANLATARDRMWVRIAFGLLCLLTLTVVGSALMRMSLYQQAYGFTVARLVVDVYEGWLGLIIIFVLISGIALNGAWVARAALISGGLAVVLLAAVNPEGWIASHNIERADKPAEIDGDYLWTLSADAVPAIEARVGATAHCLMPGSVRGDDAALWHDGWVSWNLGRALAREALGEPLPTSDVVPTVCKKYQQASSGGY